MGSAAEETFRCQDKRMYAASRPKQTGETQRSFTAFFARAECRPFPSPFGVTRKALTNVAAFRSHSADCRSEGLATSTRLPGCVHARCTAFAADTVDFPHWREHNRIPRFETESSTRACFASA